MPDLIAAWPGAQIRPVLGNPGQGVKHLHVSNRCKDALTKTSYRKGTNLELGGHCFGLLALSVATPAIPVVLITQSFVAQRKATEGFGAQSSANPRGFSRCDSSSLLLSCFHAFDCRFESSEFSCFPIPVNCLPTCLVLDIQDGIYVGHLIIQKILAHESVSTIMESDEHCLLRIDDVLAEDSHRFLRSRAAVSNLDNSMRLSLRPLRTRMQWSRTNRLFEGFRPQSPLWDAWNTGEKGFAEGSAR